jgi:hypothetical protein
MKSFIVLCLLALLCVLSTAQDAGTPAAVEKPATIESDDTKVQSILTTEESAEVDATGEKFEFQAEVTR